LHTIRKNDGFCGSDDLVMATKRMLWICTSVDCR
jgi:hypothetical protein